MWGGVCWEQGGTFVNVPISSWSHGDKSDRTLGIERPLSDTAIDRVTEEGHVWRQDALGSPPRPVELFGHINMHDKE